MNKSAKVGFYLNSKTSTNSQISHNTINFTKGKFKSEFNLNINSEFEWAISMLLIKSEFQEDIDLCQDDIVDLYCNSRLTGNNMKLFSFPASQLLKSEVYERPQLLFFNSPLPKGSDSDDNFVFYFTLYDDTKNSLNIEKIKTFSIEFYVREIYR